MDLRQFLNVIYTDITAGMEPKDVARIDMILDGKAEGEIIAHSNVQALQGLAGFMGQVN